LANVAFRTPNTILQPPRYDCVVERAEEAFAELFGEFADLRNRFDRRRNAVDLNRTEARFLQIKRQ